MNHISQDQDVSSDHRAGLFCVLYEIVTNTSDRSIKESWISLLKEVSIENSTKLISLPDRWRLGFLPHKQSTKHCF
jgi:hypothetical protein